MGETLTEVATKLQGPDKKARLIYAFNGTGKTRLSREFTRLVEAHDIDSDSEPIALHSRRCLYYSAFTEDLFYWDNDSGPDAEPKLRIHPNPFTPWVLEVEGQDKQVTSTFQNYTSPTLTPHFSEDFTSVSFSHQAGNQDDEPNIKISKGEESNFIWSVFFTLLNQVVDELNIAEIDQRSTDRFNNLTHIFIDDPVSSLDDNHVIELAVSLALLIKNSSGLQYVITTHSPLFYNVLHNELTRKTQGTKTGFYLLDKCEDGTFELTAKRGDSNTSFSYHLHLIKTIEAAISDDDKTVERYHFTLLRNLYEKTASFLGYTNWGDLLPGDKHLYYSRIINFTSHSTLPSETVAQPSPPERATVELLLNHLKTTYKFWQQEQ